MKKVYSADNMLMPAYIQTLLESSSINCIIKNQLLTGAIGEIPPVECWPEVWIMDDEDFTDAMEIINAYIQDLPESGVHWKCECGELLEGQFDTCWSCGRHRV